MIVAFDSNILCYVLDSAYPEHKIVEDLLDHLDAENVVALNPTVIHEVFHVLVNYLRWVPQEAADRLKTLLGNQYVTFFSQTKKTTQMALDLAVRHSLGGRDSLILANYLANGVPILYTNDSDLLQLRKVSWKNSQLEMMNPLKKRA